MADLPLSVIITTIWVDMADPDRNIQKIGVVTSPTRLGQVRARSLRLTVLALM